MAMPFVRIDLLEGRPPETLRLLFRPVSETVAGTLGTPIERVRVMLNEVPADLWGIGGVPASETDGVPSDRPRGGGARA